MQFMTFLLCQLQHHTINSTLISRPKPFCEFWIPRWVALAPHQWWNCRLIAFSLNGNLFFSPSPHKNTMQNSLFDTTWVLILRVIFLLPPCINERGRYGFSSVLCSIFSITMMFFNYDLPTDLWFFFDSFGPKKDSWLISIKLNMPKYYCNRISTCVCVSIGVCHDDSRSPAVKKTRFHILNFLKRYEIVGNKWFTVNHNHHYIKGFFFAMFCCRLRTFSSTDTVSMHFYIKVPSSVDRSKRREERNVFVADWNCFHDHEKKEEAGAINEMNWN